MSAVAFFDFFYTFGGAQKSTATLLNRFHELGRDCLFIAPSPPAAAFRDFLQAELICLHDQPRPALQHSGANVGRFLKDMVGVVRRLTRLARDRNLGDAVFVTSSPKGLFALVLFQLSSRVPVRIAYYCRGEGKAGQFGRLGRFLTRKFADRILCVSDETRRNMQAWGVRPDRLHVVHTSVDVRPLRVLGRSLPPPDAAREPVRILFAASFIRTKGLHHLLGSLALIRSRRPVRLSIAGDIPNDSHAAYADACRDLAAKVAPNVTVEWLGWIDDVPAAMAESEIVCLPSYTEGFPRLIVEAMVLGRIVVASSVGGIRELIADGETGFTVELDEASIAAVLDGILAMPDLEPVAVAARALIEDRYSLERQAEAVWRALVA